MLTEVLTRLNNEWLPTPLPEPLTAIKVAGSESMSRKVNFLVFGNESKHPQLLIKIIRDGSINKDLEKEHDTLSKLYRSSKLQLHIPQPIGIYHHKGLQVLVEGYLHGISVENLVRRSTNRQQYSFMSNTLSQITAWLIDFHSATFHEDYSLFNLREVEQNLLQHSPLLSEKLTNELITMAKEVDGISIPITGRHGDFWAGNILILKDGIGVIDWETFTPEASPLDDLFFFCSVYGKKNFSETFLQSNATSRELSNMVKSVMISLNLPPQFASLFFTLFLVDMAHKRKNIGHPNGTLNEWGKILSQIESLKDLVMSR